MRPTSAMALVTIGVVVAACGTRDSTSPAADAGADGGDAIPTDDYPPGAPHVSWFRDVTLLSGVAATHHPGITKVQASGIAVGDIDGDARPDLVLPTGRGATLVYKGAGGLRFTDVTGSSGVDGLGIASGAALCDLDADGDLDLLLTSDDPDAKVSVRFYRNRGDGVFTDATAAAGFVVRGATKSALCTDLDGDGLLDVYVANYSYGASKDAPERADAFYRNRGDGTFVDDARRLGFDVRGYTWTAAAADVDGDGDLDLYVGNDTFAEDDGTRPLHDFSQGLSVDVDHLLRNDGPGPDGRPVFADVGASGGAILTESRATMGILATDFTGDGKVDFFLSNYGRKVLVEARGDGTFIDGTTARGLEAIRRLDRPCVETPGAHGCLLVSWGTAFEDFDLDGNADLLVLNGELDLHAPQPQAVWRGAGAGVFTPVQTELPWMPARALVSADLDGDGDLDLALTTWGGPVRIFENVAPPRDATWITVRLRATTSAARGHGAKVRVGGRTVQIATGGLLYSSAPAEVTFALAGATTTTVDVDWPSGFHQRVASAPANAALTIVEPDLVRVAPRTANADGASTIAVVVKPANADGTPRGPGAAVTIDASAGTWSGAVVDAGDGSYTRTLVAPSSPVLSVIRVAVDGQTLGILPRVDFR